MKESKVVNINHQRLRRTYYVDEIRQRQRVTSTLTRRFFFDFSRTQRPVSLQPPSGGTHGLPAVAYWRRRASASEKRNPLNYFLCKIFIPVFFLLNFFGYSICRAQETTQDSCQRIISLAPSVTETLFALGLGSNLVGVTRYCTYPEATASITKLGGLFDTNLEAALMLSPGLVMGLQESGNLLSKFEQLGVKTMTVSDRSIKDLYSTYVKICEHCNCQQVANKLIFENNSQILPLVERRKGQASLSVALVIASSTSGGAEELYLSGKDGYYSSIFELLNAKNVFANRTAAIPSSSFETLVTLAPQAVFVIETSLKKFEDLRLRILRFLPEASVIQLKQDYAVVPGPRFPLLMQDLVQGLDSVSGQLMAGEIGKAGQ